MANHFERRQERRVEVFANKMQRDVLAIARFVYESGGNPDELFQYLRSIDFKKLENGMVIMLVEIYKMEYKRFSKPHESKKDELAIIPSFIESNHFKSLIEFTAQLADSFLRWSKELLAEIASIVADSFLLDASLLGKSIIDKLASLNVSPSSSPALNKAKALLNTRNVEFEDFFVIAGDISAQRKDEPLPRSIKNLIYSKVKNRIQKSFRFFKNNLYRIIRTSGQLSLRDAQSNSAKEIDGKVIWITRDDSRVRHLHAGWHRKKFTPRQAAINSRISPYNCRCVLKLEKTDKRVSAQLVGFNVEWLNLIIENTEMLNV